MISKFQELARVKILESKHLQIVFEEMLAPS